MSRYRSAADIDRRSTMRSSTTAVLLACALAAPALAGIEPLPSATAAPARSPSVGTAFDALMPPYDASREALSGDSLGGLAQPSRDLRRLVLALGNGLTAESAGVPEEKLGEVRALLPGMRKAADELVTAGTLPAARDAFFDLSKALIAWRKLAARGPDVAFCPMVNRSWLQPPGTPIENPFAGRTMAACGERKPG
jgi:hypothetical protein